MDSQKTIADDGLVDKEQHLAFAVKYWTGAGVDPRLIDVLANEVRRDYPPQCEPFFFLIW